MDGGFWIIGVLIVISKKKNRDNPTNDPPPTDWNRSKSQLYEINLSCSRVVWWWTLTWFQKKDWSTTPPKRKRGYSVPTKKPHLTVVRIENPRAREIRTKPMLKNNAIQIHSLSEKKVSPITSNQKKYKKTFVNVVLIGCIQWHVFNVYVFITHRHPQNDKFVVFLVFSNFHKCLPAKI